MKNKFFGLDIGATTMKVVWLDREKDGYLLNAVFSAPTPEKGLLSESPLDQEQMAQAIAQIVTEAHITTKEASIALPENQVYTRVIEMPILSDKELTSAIYWEAEQYIPVPLDTITLDYKVLSRPQSPEENPKMNVLLVGAPTSLINKYENLLSMAGLHIASIETEVLSVIRATVIGNDFPPSLIINIGAINTSLALIKNGIVLLTYSIATGGIAISRAIAADFGFSLSQAEEYKRVYGLSEDQFGGKIGKVATPILQVILTEVKKSLAFYAEKYLNEPLRQIILSGGTAKLPGITAFFATGTGIETVTANPWKILSTQEVPKEILDNAVDYTVAVGLAMREI